MHLLRTAKPNDKAKLTKIMNKTREKKTPQEVRFVIGLMKKYGSLDYSQKLAEKLAHQASNIFEKKLGFLSHQPAKDQLKSGINFILRREY